MITIKVDEKTLQQIENKYKDYITCRNVGYILYCIKKEDLIITAYDNNKKNYFKVTLQGKNILQLAKEYSLEEKFMAKKEKVIEEKPYYIDVSPQIGSDEVGTGDFLAPIVVCAAYVDSKVMEYINELGITDSKKLTDKMILTNIPLILKKIHYSCKVLSNQNYNNLNQNYGYNLNQIKALLHNSCLSILHKRCPYIGNIYMDQFAEEKKYYEYLKNQPNILKNIVFKEKGELYFPAIALASCVARYFFLIEVKKLNDKYKMNFPLGASNKVNEFSLEFIKKYGLQEFKKISKNNFINFNQVSTIYFNLDNTLEK